MTSSGLYSTEHKSSVGHVSWFQAYDPEQVDSTEQGWAGSG